MKNIMDVLTMYENNIKLHYVEYLERYVNTVWKKDFMIEKLERLKRPKKIEKCLFDNYVIN